MPTTPLTLHHGDCLAILPTLESASVDSIVTDPPYELGFMGKQWDASGIAYNVTLWAECLRVLKPGGYLLAFGGTRTYHRMACAIEDAGFEIRDSIHWLYGSGFPKSLDVSKAIDKQRHDLADIYRVTAWIRAARDSAGIGNREIDAAFGFAGMAGHWTSAKSQPAVPTLEQVPTLLEVLGLRLDDVPAEIRLLLWDLNGPKGQPGENWWKREVIGTAQMPDAQLVRLGFTGPTHSGENAGATRLVDITAPATDAAKQWEGWGTALKPAHEPIVVARKPLAGTVAANVLQHGTGALNIDGCRVGTAGGTAGSNFAKTGLFGIGGKASIEQLNAGRWPANLVLTHAAECADTCAPSCPVAALDAQSGVSMSKAAVMPIPKGHAFAGESHGGDGSANGESLRGFNDTGGASRFFTVADYDPIADAVPFAYIAKPGRAERDAGLDGLPERHVAPEYRPNDDGSNGLSSRRHGVTTPRQNHHPTVKPVELMRWLVRLVTPTGGTVLDPFAGSGTTLVAARLEGFAAVGIEMTADYLSIIEGRLAWAAQQAVQLSLFGEEGTAA